MGIRFGLSLRSHFFLILSLFTIPTAHADSSIFKNCSKWLRAQIDLGFSAFKDHSFFVDKDGNIEIVNSSVVLKYKKKKGEEKIVLKYDGTPLVKSGFSDSRAEELFHGQDIFTLSLETKNGRPQMFEFDRMMGGNRGIGLKIGENRYNYYRQVHRVSFGYNERGCYPKQLETWVYPGRNNLKARGEENILFTLENCNRLRLVHNKLSYKKIMYKGKQRRHRTGVPIKIAIFPADNYDLRKEMAEVGKAFGLSDRHARQFISLKSVKDFLDESLWEHVLYLGIDKCQLRDYTPNDPTQLKFFLQD